MAMLSMDFLYKSTTLSSWLLTRPMLDLSSSIWSKSLTGADGSPLEDPFCCSWPLATLEPPQRDSLAHGVPRGVRGLDGPELFKRDKQPELRLVRNKPDATESAPCRFKL